MTPGKIAEVSAFLHESMGLDFAATREKELFSKLSKASPDFGFENTHDFINWLLSKQPPKEQLIKLAKFLTIGETYFFREKKALDFLEHHYLPQLLAERENTTRTLKIWSAGCSSGEEPYSLAILMQRLLKDTDSWKIKILATDINPEFINKAKRGVYTKWSFRNTSDEFRNTYFEKIGANQYKIKDWVKNKVEFKFLNIASDSFPSINEKIYGFDVILCRNVLIYFSPAAIKNVVTKFYKTLVPGGIFIVSPVEASSILNTEFSHFMFQGISIFQKNNTNNKTFPTSDLKKSETKASTNSFISTQKAVKPFVTPVKKESKQIIPQQSIPATNATKVQTVSSSHVSLKRVKEYANAGELDRAQKLCSEIIQNDKLNEAAYFLLATIFTELGDYKNAAATLERVLFLNSEFVMAEYALGELKIKTDDNIAMRHFKNVLKILSKRNNDEVVEFSDGLTVKSLREIINNRI